MPDEFLIVACSDMGVINELLSRLANSLEGCYLFRDDRIPILVLKNDAKNIMRVRDFLVVLMTMERDFIGRLMFLEKRDLVGK